MAHPAVVTAFHSRLAAGFAGCPVFEENVEPEGPADAGSFIVLQFPYSTSEWVSADEFLEEGGARFVAHVGKGAGANDGRALLESIAALFRGVRFDDVQTFAPTSPVSDDGNDRANVWRLSMVVPYEFVVQG